MNGLLSNTKLFMKRNGSTILTCMGGVGVIATTVAAVKATPKAMLLLEQAEEEKGGDLTKLEKVYTVAPVYIPSVVIGVSTITCIFGANIFNKHQQAALTSAYALLNSSYKEYKAKFKELYGDEAEAEVVKNIADDKYKESDIQQEDGKVMFYDEFSRRFFHSTLESVQRAEYQINRDLVMQEWATINDFYKYLNIPLIEGGDIVGWSNTMNGEMYWQTWVDFSHDKVVDDDGLEYYIVRMFQEPMPDFENFIS